MPAPASAVEDEDINKEIPVWLDRPSPFIIKLPLPV